MRLDTLLGTKYPLIQGGMANIATRRICRRRLQCRGARPDRRGRHGRRDPARPHPPLRELTDKPFGVNIMLMNPAAPEMAKIVAEEHVPVVTTGAGNPGAYVPMWKEAGIQGVPGGGRHRAGPPVWRGSAWTA